MIDKADKCALQSLLSRNMHFGSDGKKGVRIIWKKKSTLMCYKAMTDMNIYRKRRRIINDEDLCRRQ